MTSHNLAALLPKTVGEWKSLVHDALARPIASVWYPPHFYLTQVTNRLRYSPQKPSDAVLTDASASGSAVLLLLSPSPTGGSAFQDMCITLTKRTTKVSTHKGQMSFPGGRCDPGESPAETAQREALEETGLDPASYSIVGGLTPISFNMLRAPLSPQVAIAEHPVSPHVASPNEVSSVHYLHLSTVLLRAGETSGRAMKFHSFSSKEPSYFPCFFTSDSQDTVTAPLKPSAACARVPSDNGYDPALPEDFPGQLVWGLTSFVLCEFTARLAAELEARHPDVEAAKAVNVLRCTDVLARDPECPAHA